MAKSLSFTDVGKSDPCRKFLMSQIKIICLLALFRKNKILRKISEFTVIISLRKRELDAVYFTCTLALMFVSVFICLFLTVPWVGL